jgi:hypothetical protein
MAISKNVFKQCEGKFVSKHPGCPLRFEKILQCPLLVPNFIEMKYVDDRNKK